MASLLIWLAICYFYIRRYCGINQVIFEKIFIFASMWKTSTLLFSCFFCLLSLVGKAQSAKTTPFSDGGSKVVKAYPNPASSRINFELQNNNEQGYEIIVFNFLGKRIDQIKNLNTRTTVELDKYYSGLYIFQLRDKQGNLVESGKFNVVK
ncbi:hypothetical protein Cpin_6902 [Chitinophaga pinensis DSM 2588]|uniref:Secretion system C-terminal sorting domain-containing protein n=2 Tax=Chitinophaga pinensis TaxID=79329 RepID=A0A979GC59_CHIPD|nr:hypothetical protein Cpin_6902 [Chitinophaga pinensis DSM 2588]